MILASSFDLSKSDALAHPTDDLVAFANDGRAALDVCQGLAPRRATPLQRIALAPSHEGIDRAEAEER